MIDYVIAVLIMLVLVAFAMGLSIAVGSMFL